MNKAIPPFVSHCLELLDLLGAVRAKRMFGGWGLYVDDVFIALIAGDRLYLKADAQNKPAFEAAGCEPFVYDAKTKAVVMSYWSAPPDALDSPALMLPWARRALQAALQSRAAKLKPELKPKLKPELKPKRAPGASPAPQTAKPAPRKPPRAA